MLFGEGPQIKNIAADLNKLFRQGSLLNQSVQTVEGDSTADQGTSDLLAARDPVIQEISVGMSGKQSARYTVSGTPPLSLANSLGKPLTAWSVDVLPYQEGTGDPSPSNVRPIHGTDKLNLFVEESYDQSATPKAVLTLPQTVYTGTIGSDGGESRWGEVDLGTLTWTESGSNPGVFSTTQLQNLKMINEVNYMCEVYKPISATSASLSTMPDYSIKTNATYSQYLYIKDTNYTGNVSGLVASITGKKFVYELATPTAFAVPSVTIPTPTGTATTWATAEDGTADGMEVTYVGKA